MEACIHVNTTGLLDVGSGTTVAFYGKDGNSALGTANRNAGVFMDGTAPRIKLHEGATLQTDFGYQQDSGVLACMGVGTTWTIDTSYQAGNIIFNVGRVNLGSAVGDYGLLRLHTRVTGAPASGTVTWYHDNIFIGAKDDDLGHQSQILTDMDFVISNADRSASGPTFTTAYSGTDPIAIIQSLSGTINALLMPAPNNYVGRLFANPSHYVLFHT